MSAGVMYIASGEEYVSEAITSAESVRKHMPDVDIALVTDDDIRSTAFDDILDLNDAYPSFGISTIKPNLSPYDRTLFLDSDTYVTEPVDDLFGILDDHHMAFTQSPGRLSVKGLPDPWVEFNTGVIAYRSSSETDAFFSRWQDLHEESLDAGVERNQPSFARTVYESDIDYFVLPREYNCRIPRFGYLAHDAKIVHGRHTVSLSEVADRLNGPSDRRVYWPKIRSNLAADQTVLSQSDIENKPRHIAFRFKRSVQRSGFRHALKQSYKELAQLLR